MNAPQVLREGRLDEALADLQEQVRSQPADPKLRVFLSELLVVLGQWERAFRQLSVVAELDAKAIPMARAYQEAIRCETLRGEIFAGRRTPLVLGDPEPWLALALEALSRSAAGDHAAAAKIRERGWSEAPASSGRIDGRSFEWISDADSRLGPILEGIVNGRYYWIPFARISRLTIEAPADLRDVVWMPAHFTWRNSGEVVGLIPTRYPGSETSEDHAVVLARKTEWVEVAEGEFYGSGQRMFATDCGEYGLMDVRVIEFDPEGGDAQSGA